MKKTVSIILLVCLIVLGFFLGCKERLGYEPLRFEKMTKTENLAFQANVDGTLSAGSWEYRFKIKQADRVSLIVEVLSNQPDLSVKLVKKGILFDTTFKCTEPITNQAPCKLEIKEPDKGDYALALDHGTKDQSPVQYRIFAAVHGPGYASVLWEEEVARR